MPDGSVTIAINGDSKGIEKELDKLNKKLDETENQTKQTGKAGSRIGAMFSAGAKIAAGAIATATTGIGTLVGVAVNSYAQYEQLVGGVDTLFKSSSDKLQQYAADAYKTAGMSANDYMETATSFAGSLIQSLGGDTEKAAEYANRAITDMSDNANKMGTNIQMLQNAYQGFARNSFVMLDNLKLGYAGTQAEMQRLLNDAEKISGIHYDISSYADIVDAIHVIQTEMKISGITADEAAELVKNGALTEEEAFDLLGTTAKEAATTIEGSVLSTKAAWSNLMTGMADDNADFDKLVDNFVQSAENAGKNLLPRIEKAISGVGDLIVGLAPVINQVLPVLLTNILPALVSAGGQLINGLIQGVIIAGPQLLQTGGQLLLQIGNGIINGLPQLAEFGVNILKTITNGIQTHLPDLIATGMQTLMEFSGGLRENFGLLFDAGLGLITALAQSLIDNIPVFIETIPTIISNIAGLINDNAPKLLMTGIALIAQLAQGLLQAIPTIIQNIPQIIKAIWDTLMAVNWLDLGMKLIQGIANGVRSMAGEMGSSAGEVVANAAAKFRELPGKLLQIGRDAISRIGSAIRGGAGTVRSAAESIITTIATKLGELPGKAFEIGKNIVSKIWDGIVGMAGWLADKVSGFISRILPGGGKKSKSGNGGGGMGGGGMGGGALGGMSRGAMQTALRTGSAQPILSAVSSGGMGGGDTVITYTQTFNSPKALSRREILRQTNNAVRRIKAF